MSRRTRLLAVLAVLALVTAGCGGDGESGDTAQESPAGPAGSEAEAESEATSEGAQSEGETQEVSVVAADYVFTEAPDELTAGVVRLSLDNQGEVDHEVALLEIGDTSLEQFLTDFPPVLEGGPFPDYAENVAVPIELPGGESGDVTFTIAEGEYALFCALDGDADALPSEGVEGAPEGGEGEGPPPGPPHYERGMVQTLSVGPGDAELVLPEADGSITAVDYGFEVDVEAGDSAVNFVNAGPDQVHFASVSVFPEGTDATAAEEAFQTLLELPEDQPPPEDLALPEDIAFSGIFSTGLGGAMQVPDGFESGRTYVTVCFIQDRAGGPPHAIANQMYEVFTVE
jgi:plastocyanin